MIATWKNAVRLRVGEITRKQQFDLWRYVTSENTTEDVQLALEEALDMLTAMAVHKVEWFDGSTWQPIGEAQTISVNEQEFVLSFPVTPALIQNLPRTLAELCVDSAIEANGELNTLLSFPSARRMNMQSTSVTEPDSAPSSEPITNP